MALNARKDGKEKKLCVSTMFKNLTPFIMMKRLGFGLKPNVTPNSEFDSIHFGIEIKKKKFMGFKNFETS